MWLEMVPAALSIMGSFMGAAGASRAGQAAADTGARQQAADEFQAEQYDQNAIQAVAAAQRVSLAKEHESKLLQSRALAVAAASGGGASDPTVMNLIARIAGEGAYREAIDLYQGEDKSRQLNLAAAGKRYEGAIARAGGEAKQSAYEVSASGSLLTGAGTLFTKYGKGGFQSAGSTSSVDSNGINWDNV